MKFKESPATFRGRPSREHLHSVHGAAAAEFVAALPTRAPNSLERVQGQVVRVHPSIGLIRVKLPAKVSVSQAIESLYRSGAVEYAEPNALLIPQGTPNDPLFSSQWALPRIMAPEAWDIVYPGNVVPPGSKNTIVAVVDTGVDYLHEDFYLTLDNPPVRRYTLPTDPPLYFPGDPLTSNLWVNRGDGVITHGEEVENPYVYPPSVTPVPWVFIRNYIDNDANNFVDDYFGINTTVTPALAILWIPPFQWRSRHRHGGNHRRHGQQRHRHGRRQLANQDHVPQMRECQWWHRGQRHHLYQLCPGEERDRSKRTASSKESRKRSEKRSQTMWRGL